MRNKSGALKLLPASFLGPFVDELSKKQKKIYSITVIYVACIKTVPGTGTNFLAPFVMRYIKIKTNASISKYATFARPTVSLPLPTLGMRPH